MNDEWDTGAPAAKKKEWYEDPKEQWEKLPQAHKIVLGSVVAILLFFVLLPYIGDPLESEIEQRKQYGGLSKYQMRQFADMFEQGQHYEETPTPDWKNAIYKYKQCLSYTKESPLLLAKLANAYIMSRGEYDMKEVLELFQKALDLIEEKEKKKKPLVARLPDSDEEDKKDFLNIRQRGVSYNDTLPLYYLNYAKALVISGVKDKAVALLRTAPENVQKDGVGSFLEFIESGEFRGVRTAIFTYLSPLIERALVSLKEGGSKTKENLRKEIFVYLRGTKLDAKMTTLRSELDAAARASYEKVKWFDQNKLARACVELLPAEGKKLKASDKDPKKQTAVVFKKMYTLYPRMEDLGVKKTKIA